MNSQITKPFFCYFNKKKTTYEHTKKIIITDSQFTEKFITAHADVINCNYIIQNIEMCIHFSDEFFLKFNRIILWNKINPYQNLTTEFVHKYQDKLSFIAWYNKKKERHRDNDEPAVIYANGIKEWCQNGIFIKKSINK